MAPSIDTRSDSWSDILVPVVAVLVVALVLIGPLTVPVAEAASSLVSWNDAGTGGGSHESSEPLISGDGRYVLFSSWANNLHPLDTSTDADLYLRDTVAGTTTLVSINAAGSAAGNGSSQKASLSSSGRIVAFTSSATDLTVDNDVNLAASDVFVRDLDTGVTELISVSLAGGASGNGSSTMPMISADGRYLVFSSYATDLTADADGNLERDVFLRDRPSGTTTLISSNGAGTAAADASSASPAISADGSTVVFLSRASDLLPASRGSMAITAGTHRGAFTGQVFAYDVATGVVELLTYNHTGSAQANDDSYQLKVNNDGTRVAFRSWASDLVLSDSNSTDDIFVHDRDTGVNELVSLNLAGTDSGNNESLGASISADGTLVAFTSWADDLVAVDGNGQCDVFLRDLDSGTTTMISVNAGGTDSGNGASEGAFLSADGRWLAYRSAASDLVSVDGNGQVDVFLLELVGARTRNVTRGGDRASGAYIVLSAVGPLVSFSSDASNLVPGAPVTSDIRDIFLSNLALPVFSDGFESGDTTAWSSASD